MTKTELQQFKYLQAEIHQLITERDYWLSKTQTRCRPLETPRSSGGNHDPFPMIVDKRAELLDRINEKIDALCALRLRIEAAVEGLEGSERILIRARYIECKRWREIADDMYYDQSSIPWLHTMHDKILRRFAMESNGN